ncbi:MAG: tRNA pseudouridine(38-40) synthase TruA [Thermoplasmatales archaeon]|nr:tRNA pseudouridine(38-40) synthase TruA [Thermoplasmatales archaeon]
MTILSGTMRIAIKFAYDGKKYSGYARQPNLKTVERELVEALVKHNFLKDTKESVFRSASRTDKNVSALCNVVAFNTSTSKKIILNDLSNDFSSTIVYGIKDVDLEFNPRYAKMRQYRYYLPIPSLDIEKIITTSSCFTGEHNFSNFARIGSFKNPVRTIDNIILTPKDGFLIIDFFAQAFLWHQIRRIISALIKVGNGKLEKEQINDALANPDKKVDFGLTPAEPLILMDIKYDFEFEYDKKLLDQLSLFEKNICSSLLKVIH